MSISRIVNSLSLVSAYVRNREEQYGEKLKVKSVPGLKRKNEKKILLRVRLKSSVNSDEIISVCLTRIIRSSLNDWQSVSEWKMLTIFMLQSVMVEFQ